MQVHLRRWKEGAPQREGPLGHVGVWRLSAGVQHVLQEYTGTQRVTRIMRVHLRRWKEGAPRRERCLGRIGGRRASAGVPRDLQ